MRDDEFEWDDAKAARSYAKHGVGFDAAREVFDDAYAISWLDQQIDYGEDRYNIVGMVEGRLLFVAYALHGEVVRIISARAAQPYEKRRHHEEER